MALITCQNVAFAYEGHAVVSETSFSVNSGDYLCIVGENGSGKSTLVKGLLGLLLPSKGSIMMGDGLKKTEIGYLPQQSAAQRDFPASVWEVVLSGCKSRSPFLLRKEKDRALAQMKRMNIETMKNRCYRELSGGQQQRVLLARALCATEKLLLLDEPVAGLDPVVTKEMYRLIAELNKSHGITVIMISHDILAATQFASHILHLQKEPLFFGSTSEYVNSPLGSRFMGGEQNA